MEFKFDSREAASVAAVDRAVAALERRLDGQGEASVVVSGGSTPVDFLRGLATRPLDWEHVHVLPSDERWVGTDHDDSNESMIRRTLLNGPAADAKLHGLYSADMTVDERCEDVGKSFKTLPFPFAFVLLGMGADGHFASLFPDAENLAAGLDPENTSLCIAVRTAASPHARISLTLSALARSDEIVLLAFGDAKRKVLDEAMGSSDRYPVSHLLWQKRAPVRVVWAP